MSKDQSTTSLLPPQYMPSSPSLSKLTKKRGFLSFIGANRVIAIAFVAGSACCTAVFAYTWWLSDKPLGPCPAWAIACPIPWHVEAFRDNAALIQGAITTAYSIGLAAMLYAACAFGEAAVWPILHDTQHDLKHIDVYLSASRGSLLSLAKGLVGAQCRDSVVVLLCVAIAASLHTLAPTIVGRVYSKQNITVNYNSNQTQGGGIGLEHKQWSPGPAPIPGAAVAGAGLYSAWSNGLAVEPLSEYRNYIVDRAKLSAIGNFSAAAINVDMTIACAGHPLDLTTHKSKDKKLVHAATNLPGNDGGVALRIQPKLTTWIDAAVNTSSTRSVVTVVFASLNGTIEGGTTTEATKWMNSNWNATNGAWTGVSAIACDVAVDLQDDTTPTVATKTDTVLLSNLDMMSVGDGYGPISSLATWLGAATTVMGISVEGAQPMFSKGHHGLPVTFTTVTKLQHDSWTLEEITSFIEVSAGAIAMSIPGTFPPLNPSRSGGTSYSSAVVHFPSQTFMLALERKRAYLLLAPVASISLVCVVLVAFNVVVHGRDRIPAMRLATVSELIKSGQTVDMRAAVDLDVAQQDRSGVPPRLGDMKVKFGVDCNGTVGLGMASSISRFE